MSRTVTRRRSPDLRTLPSSRVPTPSCWPLRERRRLHRGTEKKQSGLRREGRQLGESVNEFISQTFTEVVLITAGTHISEWQNCDCGNIVFRRAGTCSSIGIGIRERSHELVSATMPRFDEAWLLCIIVERLAQLLDAGGERVIADHGAIPYRCEEVLFCDRLACVDYKHF